MISLRIDKVLEIVPSSLRSWGYEIADRCTRFDGLNRDTPIQSPYDSILYSTIGLTQALVRYKEHGNWGIDMENIFTHKDVLTAQRLLVRLLETRIENIGARFLVTYRVQLPPEFQSLITFSRRGSLHVPTLLNAVYMRNGMPAVVNLPAVERYAQMFRGYTDKCATCGVPAPTAEHMLRSSCPICGTEYGTPPKIRLSKARSSV